MDFYQIASERAKELSKTEQELLQFAVKNLHLIKKLSIREFASKCFVSTATVFRFVKKLGFEGYSEFQKVITITESESRTNLIPMTVKRADYRDSYLKNITEAVKVISDEKIEAFNKILSRHPQIYILAEGLSLEIAHYMYRILTISGYMVTIPTHDYEIKAVARKMTKDDVLMTLSFTGDNQNVVRHIEQIFAIATPVIISFTRADNNVIQNMSDLNFYTFADQMSFDGNDITSRCGMIAIFETLMYRNMADIEIEIEGKKNGDI
ncbi:MAG: MurR/RpiR family transcriptional regulator [Lachnospiraceae bacterium]